MSHNFSRTSPVFYYHQEFCHPSDYLAVLQPHVMMAEREKERRQREVSGMSVGAAEMELSNACFLLLQDPSVTLIPASNISLLGMQQPQHSCLYIPHFNVVLIIPS